MVGVGATPYYKRGQSYPETELSMMCTAILGALDDAGLTVNDLDGFAIYSFACDPAEVASVLGVPEVRFAASLTSGGGGCAGALGLAAAAIHGGMADVCVTLMSLQQLHKRLGGSEIDGVLAYASMSEGGGSPYGGSGMPPSTAFSANSGLLSPGHSFSVLTQRHMHLYGTKREHFAEVAISQRENAIRRPTSLQKQPLTLDEYFAARMISDPLCLFDYTHGDRRRGRGDHDVGRARQGPAPAARLHPGVGQRRQRPLGAGDLPVLPGCPTTSSRRRVTGRWRSGSTRWPASRPPTSTSRCSTTTSRRWSSCSSRTTGSARSARAARSSPRATSAGRPAPSRSTPTAATSRRPTSSA